MLLQIQPDDDLSGRFRAQLVRRRALRMLTIFLVASAAAHAALLVLLPPLGPEGDPPGASRLEVIVLQPEPLSVAPSAAAPRPLSKQERERAPGEAEPRLHPERPAADAALAEPRPDERRSHPADATNRPAEPSATEIRASTAEAAAPHSNNASYLRNPAPRYPQAARRAGEQGTVTLRVLVARDGSPARVDVEKTSGSANLDNTALEAVKAWRFTPARQRTEPVESWMLVPVVFRLEGAS